MKKRKAYEIIGRITVFVLLHTGLVLFGLWALSQNTIY